MESLKDRMKKSYESTVKQLSSFRTGRANPDLLSRVQVNYYGSPTPLLQLANITVPENTLLQINVFDKGAVQDVEKAIQKSDLGLNPQVEGSVIRLRLPELTEDRRRELVKQIKKQVEDGKVSIRNIRRDEVEQVKLMEKEKEISEDESKRQQDDVQKITDDYISKMDILSKEKESDIMKV